MNMPGSHDEVEIKVWKNERIVKELHLVSRHCVVWSFVCRNTWYLPNVDAFWRWLPPSAFCGPVKVLQKQTCNQGASRWYNFKALVSWCFLSFLATLPCQGPRLGGERLDQETSWSSRSRRAEMILRTVLRWHRVPWHFIEGWWNQIKDFSWFSKDFKQRNSVNRHVSYTAYTSVLFKPPPPGGGFWWKYAIIPLKRSCHDLPSLPHSFCLPWANYISLC